MNNKMFDSKKDIFNFVLGVFLFIIVVYISLKISIIFINTIKKMFDNYPTISVAIVAGLLTFISTIIGKILENKLIINNQIRKEKQKVYIDFLNWLINNVLYAEISNNKNIVSEIREYQKQMTIYASDNVLKAWAVFKEIAINGGEIKKGMEKNSKTRYYIGNEAPALENLVLAIRKDLGYRNRNIKQYDILRLYINDINKYL